MNSQIWLMEEMNWREMVAQRSMLAQKWFSLDPQALNERAEESSRRLRRVSGKVALMSIEGVIEQKPSFWSLYYGEGSAATELIGEALNQHLADKSVEAIVMNIDSPGGTVYGVEELAEKIYSSRGKKPIYAIANSLAASAAYWIGTAADKLYVTPGGDVGSVGVYAIHWDDSAWLEKMGSKPTIIKAGKYKAEGNPFEPLSDEAREHMQEGVDDVYARFTKAVAKHRGTTVADVKANYGQGRVLNSNDAKAAKMVDGIMTLEQLLGRLGVSGGSTSAQRADDAESPKPSMEVLRRRYEAAKRKEVA